MGTRILEMSLCGAAVVDDLTAQLVAVDVVALFGAVVCADVETEEDCRAGDTSHALGALKLELHG